MPQHHQRESSEDRVEDDALRQVDRDHPLAAHDIGIVPDEPGHVGEEADRHEADAECEHAARERRQQAVEHVDVDVTPRARAHGRAEEDDRDEAVDRDLLRPREAVVQHVAREELEEDGDRHAEKDRQRDPVLDSVVGEADGSRLLLERVGEFLRRHRCVDVLRHKAVPAER